MCQAYPGPRCASHTREDLNTARVEYLIANRVHASLTPRPSYYLWPAEILTPNKQAQLDVALTKLLLAQESVRSAKRAYLSTPEGSRRATIRLAMDCGLINDDNDDLLANLIDDVNRLDFSEQQFVTAQANMFENPSPSDKNISMLTRERILSIGHCIRYNDEAFTSVITRLRPDITQASFNNPEFILKTLNFMRSRISHARDGKRFVAGLAEVNSAVTERQYRQGLPYSKPAARDAVTVIQPMDVNALARI